MNLVTLTGVSKQYSERLLLDEVDLRINADERIGLIGVNGSGKSTLLRLVAGLEPPDAGKVTVWGGVRIGALWQEPSLDDEATALETVIGGEAPQLRLLQEHHRLARALADRPADEALQERLHRNVEALDHAGGWAAEAQAKALLDRLGIAEPDGVVGALSGGQRKRVALARALIDPVDLLILDEPTNHLDAETIDWLEAELRRGERALLMVTHDRYVLDRVANRIVELDRRSLHAFSGGYTRYLEQRAARHERLAKAEADEQRTLRRELEWLRRGAKARSTKQKARKDRVEELQRLRQDRGEERVAFALASRRLGKQVLEARGIRKAYGGHTVLDGLTLELGPGERIGILGPNGAGKSTLLDILAGRLEQDEGQLRWGETVRLAYFDQRSAGLDDDQRLIDYVEQAAPLVHAPDGSRITSAQALEWLLFPRPQQQAYVGSLSGGERRRLYLLVQLLHQPNVLLLDEPTNDLDIETLGVLEGFLEGFAGTLIVVSHDRYFLDRNVDQLAVLEDGRLLTGYPTPFESYLRIRREQQAAEAASASSAGRTARGGGPSGSRGRAHAERADVAGDATTQDDDPPRHRKLSYHETRELEGLTAAIERDETRKAEVSEAINDAGADPERLAELAAELATLEARLEETVERWVELGEIAEQAGA